jgi:alcohol dehydrogenase (cytochrome c)
MKKGSVIVIFACLGVATLFGQTTQELVNDGKNTDNVLTMGMGYDRKNYSPLNQINRSNVKRLVPIWATSVMNDLGELAAPVVYDGVMYIINGKWTFALDVGTGRQIWRTPVTLEPGGRGNSITRGAPAIYNGKLFRVTVDNHLVALDMKTGDELWNQKFAESKEGYSATAAPIVANGVVISGMAGGESTTRGFLDGWDPDTGKQLWRRYTIPAPGEPGSETWPKNSDVWKRGGGPTWLSGSYDPELDLVYWGTGNPSPYDPHFREGMDSLFTSSVLAIRPKTGEVACYFQYTPNDVFDADGNDQQVLADIQVSGRLRKVMMQTNKSGFLYTLDRTNCSLIAAHPYTRMNWSTGVDMKTGRPMLTDLYKHFLDGEEVEIYPSRGTNAVPIAFNPNTGLIYAPSWEVPRIQKITTTAPGTTATSPTGVTARQPTARPGTVLGHFVAINPLTGEKKWEIPLTDYPSSAGILATGGGLLFVGKLGGELAALDEATGKTLWEFKTSSSINASAITYTHNGRQFVTVASGRGGANASRQTGDKVPSGGSVWTFALMPQ